MFEIWKCFIAIALVYGTHQLLVYVNDFNMLVGSAHYKGKRRSFGSGW
jgi:hypothetical protein